MLQRKSNTHFMFSNFFFLQKSCSLWDNVEKYCRVRQDIYDNIIQHMHIACWIPKVTNMHSEYVTILIVMCFGSRLTVQFVTSLRWLSFSQSCRFGAASCSWYRCFWKYPFSSRYFAVFFGRCCSCGCLNLIEVGTELIGRECFCCVMKVSKIGG